MATYSSRDIRKLTGLTQSVIRSLKGAGHLDRTADRRGAERYTEGDLVVLRIVAALKAAGVPARRILQSLGGIRQELPVATGRQEPSPDPGAVADDGATLVARDRVDKHRQAEEHFQAALALEDTDVATARARYLAALKLHRHHVEARINLGRLLHLDGHLEEAERIYRAAKFSNATLSFNLALLLEDMGREEEAVLTYREALGLDPKMHDIHFNLSRLHERAQRPREALFHLLAYRRTLRNLTAP